MLILITNTGPRGAAFCTLLGAPAPPTPPHTIAPYPPMIGRNSLPPTWSGPTPARDNQQVLGGVTPPPAPSLQLVKTSWIHLLVYWTLPPHNTQPVIIYPEMLYKPLIMTRCVRILIQTGQRGTSSTTNATCLAMLIVLLEKTDTKIVVCN